MGGTTAGTPSPWGGVGGGGQSGTGNPSYRATAHHDNNSSAPTYIQAITAMEAYKEKSFEELRWEDYQRGNNKGGGMGASAGQGGGLGLGSSGGFGGGGLGGGFGSGSATGSFGSMGGGTGGFGSTSAQAPSPFGAGASSTGFGKAATAGGFGATTPSSFGTPSTGTPLFGQTPGLSSSSAGFGSSATPGLGGGGVFGGASAPAPGAFGASSTGGLGASPFGSSLGSGGGGGASSTLGGFGSTTATPFGQSGGAGALSAKTPSPATGGFGGTGAFGTSTPGSTAGFGTPATSLGGGAQQKPGGAFGGFGFSTTPGSTTGGGLGLGGLGGFGSSLSTPAGGAAGGFGATPAPSTLGSSPFAVSAFGKTPAPATPAPSPFAPSGFGTGGLGAASPFGLTSTPSAFPSSTGVGATTPSFSFSSPNVTLGGSMQFSQQQQSLQQPQSSLQLQQQQQQQSPFQQQQFYTPQSEQRPFQILMSSSGGRRAALKPEAFDATPPSLQQYRDTPRSAAKLLPRGLRTGALETALGRGPAAASRGGRSGMEEDFPNMVSPASDSFPGRSHKHLVIDQDDIFAAESKIFDLDELPGRDRLVDANGASGTPGGGNPLQRSSSGGGGQPTLQSRIQDSPSHSVDTVGAGRGRNNGVEESKSAGPPVSQSRAPTLTLPDYFTSPSLAELRRMDDAQLRRVRNFCVTREGYGKIEWEGETDVLGLNLDELVRIEAKEVRVYDDVPVKDEEGKKLNKPAVVTLFSVRHRRKSPEEYGEHLRELCRGWDRVEFLDYQSETGRWTFKVSHFSKYGVEDEDDEEEGGTTGHELRKGKGGDEADGDGRVGQKMAQETASGLGTGDSGARTGGYGIPDSDEDDKSVTAEEVELVEDGFEDEGNEVEGVLSEEERGEEEVMEMPPVGGRAPPLYGLEASRIKTLVGIFGVEEEDDTEGTEAYGRRARAESEERPLSSLEDDGGFGRRDLFSFSEGRNDGVLMVEDSVEERAIAMAPSLPSARAVSRVAPAPSASPALGFVAPSLMRGCGAVKTSPTDDTLLAVATGRRARERAGEEGGTGRKPVDYSAFMGRSFRVGWGPDGSLAAPFVGRVVRPGMAAKVEAQVLVKSLAVTPEEAGTKGGVEGLRGYLGPLGVHKAFARGVEPASETRAPRAGFRAGGSPATGDVDVGLYHHMVDCLHALATEATRREDDASRQTWELFNALWGQEGGGKARPLPLSGSLGALCQVLLPDGASHNDWERRCQAVCRWLKRIVRREVEDLPVRGSGDESADLRAVLDLMKSHRITDAASLASKSGFLRLATLIPLAGHKPATDYLRQQPALRRTVQDPALAAIYGLLSGTGSEANETSDEGPKAGLDWMRRLGEYMWFKTDGRSPGAGSAGAGDDDTDRLILAIEAFDDEMPSPPLPAWLRARWERGRGRAWHDARVGPNSLFYDLLQMYRSEAYPLSLVLDPRGLTENERDYRLSWLMLTLLGALSIGHPTGPEAVEAATQIWMRVTSSLVFQLVGMGLWPWAVYVLLHAPETPARTDAVKDLVGRFGWAFQPGSTDWSFLVDELGVPAAWLEDARATYLRAQGVLFLDEGKGASADDALGHFLRAGDTKAAAELIMNVVAPRLLIDDRGPELHALLAGFLGPERGELTDATINSGNKACWAYLEVLEALRHLEDSWGEKEAPAPAHFEEQLMAILPSLVDGGQGGDRNGCFNWCAERLDPGEAGRVIDMYAQRGSRSAPDSMPPPLHAIRNMVLTDVIKKLFFFHRLQARERSMWEEGMAPRSCLPGKSQLCRLEDMCQDYALQQVGCLTSDFIARRLDGDEVF